MVWNVLTNLFCSSSPAFFPTPSFSQPFEDVLQVTDIKKAWRKTFRISHRKGKARLLSCLLLERWRVLYQLEEGWKSCRRFDQNALVFFMLKMVTGQEDVLLMATLDFHCHYNLHEAHQRVSGKVAEWHRLVLRTAIQHPSQWNQEKTWDQTEGAQGGLPETNAGKVSCSRTCLEGSPLHLMGRGHSGGHGQMPWRAAPQGSPPHLQDPCWGTPQQGHKMLDGRKR